MPVNKQKVNRIATNVADMFIQSSEGIVKETVTKKGTVIGTPICFNPIEIKEILYNPDTEKVSYRLSFNNTEVIVLGEDLASKKGILKLAGHGLKIVEKNANHLSEYLMAKISADISKYPVSYIYSKFGWKKDFSYVLGSKRYSLNAIDNAEIYPSNKQIQAIHETGTIKEWIQVTEGMIKYNPQRFKIYVGITPLLITPLKENNYSLNDFGETSTGKTLTTKLVMSMFGNPKELILSGDSTKVGMEFTSYQFCDMPINLDDTQNINSDSLVSILYMIANGKGKLRGDKSLILRELKSWNTVGLLTGESPIISEMTFKGLDARLIEIKGGLGVIDTDATMQYESKMDLQYGTFAPVLIKYILNNISDISIKHDEHRKQINELRKKLVSDNAKNIASRVSNIFATILTAGYIFEQVYEQNGGIKIDYTVPINEVFTKIISERTSDDYTTKGFDFIKSWTANNKSYFLNNGIRATDNFLNEKQYKIVGNIMPDYIDILVSVLNEATKKSGYNMRRLASDLNDRNILETDPGKTQKTVKLEGISVKVYRFKISELEKSNINTNNP